MPNARHCIRIRSAQQLHNSLYFESIGISFLADKKHSAQKKKSIRPMHGFDTCRSIYNWPVSGSEATLIRIGPGSIVRRPTPHSHAVP